MSVGEIVTRKGMGRKESVKRWKGVGAEKGGE